MIYILPRPEEENCAFKANFLKGRLGDRGHWEETKPLVWKEAGGGALSAHGEGPRASPQDPTAVHTGAISVGGSGTLVKRTHHSHGIV